MSALPTDTIDVDEPRVPDDLSKDEQFTKKLALTAVFDTIDEPRGPDDLLKDEQFMKKLAAVFCDGLFSVADEATASLIISKSLSLCDSESVLCQLIQTKFFSGHTPFYWAIVNSGESGSGMPPLLVQMLDMCEELNEQTQIDMAWAFCVQSNDEIFQNVKGKLPAVVGAPATSFFEDEEKQPIIKLTQSNASGLSVSFDIPKFFDRIVVDKGVSHYFTGAGGVWCLRAVIVNDTLSKPSREWCFELVEFYSKRTNVQPRVPGSHPMVRQVDLVFDAEGHEIKFNGTFKQGIAAQVPRTTPLRLSGHSVATFQANPYTSNENRKLSGTITVKDVTPYIQAAPQQPIQAAPQAQIPIQAGQGAQAVGTAELHANQLRVMIQREEKDIHDIQTKLAEADRLLIPRDMLVQQRLAQLQLSVAAKREGLRRIESIIQAKPPSNPYGYAMAPRPTLSSTVPAPGFPQPPLYMHHGGMAMPGPGRLTAETPSIQIPPISCAPPGYFVAMERDRFGVTFRAYCLKRNIQSDPGAGLQLDGRQVGLWDLHRIVMQEGGCAKVIHSGSWDVVAGKMGFVSFPGYEGHPARSSPGVAQKIAAYYKQYLQAFDYAYLVSYIESKNRLPNCPRVSSPSALATEITGLTPAPEPALPTQSLLPGSPHHCCHHANLDCLTTMISYAHRSVDDLRAQGVSEKSVEFVEANRAGLQRASQVKAKIQHTGGRGCTGHGLPQASKVEEVSEPAGEQVEDISGASAEGAPVKLEKDESIEDWDCLDKVTIGES
ncbi:hypothetical protein D9611_013305 [Ephemerocybe angulata]|uniref:ARID domain-containing protein n=1 Tax=Ephemerocybe angulata TaxID=980116 RepID=A0A8H5CB36_9AGAR|nr:hypothetical protein D9611_013305 [Tulosesus angulatus]